MNTSVTTISRVKASSRPGLFGVRSSRLGPHRKSLGAMVIVSALLLVGLAGSWRAPGVTMDEGIVLEYPQLVLHGEVPFRDFQSSYGPGTYLPLAAAYRVLGPSVTVERAAGVAYRLGIVLAILALLWPLGAALAVAGGSLASLALVASGGTPVAYGWYLALACLLWGLWSARAAAMAERPRLATTLWAASGLLAGAAASARPDLGVAALLSSSVFVLRAGAISRLAFTIGLGVGASPLIWNILAAGWSRFWANGVAARIHELPRSGYPFPTGLGFLLALSAATLVLAVAAIQERRRGGANPVTRGWLAAAVLSVLLLPQVFQRPDNGHFAFVAPVCLGLLPLALVRGTRSRMSRIAIPFLCAIAIGLSAAISYSNTGFVVRNDGRSYGATSAGSASQLQRVMNWLDTHVAPGRRLFVGPADLRWTFYTPTELYFLTPDLQPDGFYLELGPGDDTPLFTRQLIGGLNRADVLVLQDLSVPLWRRYVWPEAQVGSNAPNVVVRRDFRAVLKAGPYRVWLRGRRDQQPTHRAAPA